VRHISLDPTELKGALLAEGLADRMLDLERYFREDQVSCMTHDIQRVMQREPRRVSQYSRECAPLLQPA
jgi:hypothetical protein